MNYTGVYTDNIFVKTTDDEFKFPSPKRIETDRLIMKPLLENVDPSEMYDLYKRFPDTDRWFNTSMGIPNTYQETIEYFETVQELEDDNSDFFYVIKGKQKNEIIGQATIEDVDFHAEKCAIGVWLRKDRWGEGIAKEKAEGLIYSIFQTMNIQTIEVRVATENKNSISAVQSYIRSFGGQYDGCLRKTSITPKNDVVSIFVWSLTEDEFFDEDSDYNRNPRTPSR